MTLLVPTLLIEQWQSSKQNKFSEYCNDRPHIMSIKSIGKILSEQTLNCEVCSLGSLISEECKADHII